MNRMNTLAISFIVAMTASLSAAYAQAVTQIPLTEKHIQGFIAAQKGMAAVADKVQGDKPDAATQKELDTLARANGFADFAEYDYVASNISMVMSGLDPQTKTFIEPPEAIRKEIAEVTADKDLPPKEKAETIAELNEALKVAAPIQNRGNIELVVPQHVV